MIDSDFIQVSDCGNTVWIHSSEGSTVGRFSKTFGMDVHTTVSEQMDGASQCLNCTHQKPSRLDWLNFCSLVKDNYDIKVPVDLISI
jgi:hypothetical protein